MNCTQKTINFFSSHFHRKKFNLKIPGTFSYIQIAFWLKYAFQLSNSLFSHFILHSQIVHHWMGLKWKFSAPFIALFFFRNEIKKNWERSEEIIIINKFLHLQYDSHSRLGLPYMVHNVLCTASEWELYDRPLDTQILVTSAKFGVRKKKMFSLRVLHDAWEWWKRQQISTHA